MVFYMFPPLIGATIHHHVIFGNHAFACKRRLVILPLPSWDPYTIYSPVSVEIPSPISDCWPPRHKSNLVTIGARRDGRLAKLSEKLKLVRSGPRDKWLQFHPLELSIIFVSSLSHALYECCYNRCRSLWRGELCLVPRQLFRRSPDDGNISLELQVPTARGSDVFSTNQPLLFCTPR